MQACGNPGQPTVITLRLPWPPTANRRLIPARGRWVTAPEYRAWQKLAELELLFQVRGLMMDIPPLAVTIEAHPPDNRRRDLGNLEKPVVDALVRAGVIPGDHMSDLSRITLVARPMTPHGLIVVRIEPDAQA